MQALDERLIQFAANIARFASKLPNDKFGSHMADQLIRSGVSPAQNYGEAQAAESSRDFIHKMKICLKELKETNHSLRICEQYYEGNQLIQEECKPLIQESSELVKIFFKSVKTARGRQ